MTLNLVCAESDSFLLMSMVIDSMHTGKSSTELSIGTFCMSSCIVIRFYNPQDNTDV